MARTAERTFRRTAAGVLLAVAAVAPLGGGCSTWESFRERTANLKHELIDSGWDDPEAPAHMARGEELFNNRNFDAAQKEFKKVADNQNNDANMGERARFLQAECRYFLGEYPDAVDTYHRLLLDFSKASNYREKSIARMYEIAADYWLEDFRQELQRRAGEKGILRWQPSWPNPLDKSRPLVDQEGRALEALENISIQDIRGPYADKALYWCGYVNFIRGNFQQADRFFSQLVEMNRESMLRPQALAYAIQAKNLATGGAMYDGRKCAEALQLVNVAEATVPELTQNPEAAEKLTRAKFAIRSQQAEKDFLTAEYYERTGHPGSAVFYYELVRRRFPGTRYADFATERKDRLLKSLHEGHPSVGIDPVAIVKDKWNEVIGKKPPTNTDHTGSPYDAAAAAALAGGVPPGGAGGVPPGGAMPGSGVIPSGGVVPGVKPGGNVVPGGGPAANVYPSVRSGLQPTGGTAPAGPPPSGVGVPPGGAGVSAPMGSPPLAPPTPGPSPVVPNATMPSTAMPSPAANPYPSAAPSGPMAPTGGPPPAAAPAMPMPLAPAMPMSPAAPAVVSPRPAPAASPAAPVTAPQSPPPVLGVPPSAPLPASTQTWIAPTGSAPPSPVNWAPSRP